MKQATKVNAKTDERRQAIKDALWESAANWPSDFFNREGAVVFSGDIFSVGHLANLDSRGEGPEGAFYLGRKRVYLKKPFVEWLIRRMGV
jgi:hypothetical protein